MVIHDMIISRQIGWKASRKRTMITDHSAIRRVRARMGDVNMNAPVAKKRKAHDHEARMIPGLGPLMYGFPKSIITKLRYCDFHQYSSTSGSLSKKAFAANGLYDPDIDNVGHQPLFFDNYASIYNNYVVLGSKITVTFTSRTVDKSWTVGILGDDTGTTSSTSTTLMETSNSVWTIHGTSHAGPTQLFLTYEPLGDIGIDAIDDGDLNQTQVTQNPLQLWTFSTWAEPIDKSSTATCDATIEIEYTVKFNELKSQTQN